MMYSVGDSVAVTAGRYAGQHGKINMLPTRTDHVYYGVLLDSSKMIVVPAGDLSQYQPKGAQA